MTNTPIKTILALTFVLAFCVGKVASQEQQSTDISIKKLVATLDSEVYDERIQAYEALKEFNPQAVGTVVDAWLKAESLHMRRSCMALIKSWCSEENSDRRLAVLLSIWNHPAQVATQELLALDVMTGEQIAKTISQRLSSKSINVSGNEVYINRDWIADGEDIHFVAMIPGLDMVYFDQLLPPEHLEILARSSVFRIHTAQGSTNPRRILSGDHVKALSKIPSLTKLSLHNTFLDKSALEALPLISNLEILIYQMEDPSDFQLLSNVTSLRDLSICLNSNGIDFKGTDIRPLAELDLRRLNLGRCRPTPDFYELLGEFESLELLSVSRPSVESIKLILENKQITGLATRLQPIFADQCAQLISEATHLKSLFVSGTITDRGLAHLAEMDFLDKIFPTTNVASQSGRKMLRSKLGSRVDDYSVMRWRLVSEEESASIARLADRGVALFDPGDWGQLYILQEYWSGNSADFQEAMNLSGWKYMRTDLTLTESMIGQIELLERKKGIMIMDTGNHPQELVEQLLSLPHFSLRDDENGRRFSRPSK